MNVKVLVASTMMVSFFQLNVYAQQAITLKVNDNRNVNEAPGFISKSIRADFKLDEAIGISNRSYSTNLTISPWDDNSGGQIHQLNFNDGGISYRHATFNASSWNPWQKVVISDIDGNYQLNGRVQISSWPASQNTASATELSLINKGIKGNSHTWKIFTASYAGASGISSNAFEIWEYPEYSTGVIGNKRRLVIATSRNDISNNYKTVFIGPKGNLNIGYDYSHQITDYNDLSVSGNVGIGTTNTNGYKLAVNGTIKAKEIVVSTTGWADFVFRKDYQLASLDEVKKHIQEKGHLPNIPNETEVNVQGINLGDMNAKLLQKIEELTLYAIQLKEAMDKQQKEIDELKSK